MDLTEQSLQLLVDTVAFGGNEVEIELKLKDGRILTFKRKKLENGVYDSFRDRFEKSKRNRATEIEDGWN